MVTVMAEISVNGQWNRLVDIRCCAAEDDPVLSHGPWMRGRGHVRLESLVDQLCETLQEREQIIAAMKLGVSGPYRFERAEWDVVDLLSDLDGN